MDKLTIIIRMIGGRRIAGLMGNVLNRIRTTIDSPRVSLGSRVPSSGPLQNDRFVATTKKGREREVSIRGQVSNILGTPRVQLSKDWEIKNLLRKEEGFNKLKVYGDRPTFTATGKRENYPGLEGNKPTVGVGHLVQEDKEILAGLPSFWRSSGLQ